MSFDKDIRGEAWQPCAGCPFPTPGACPSRRHRPYCAIVARYPGFASKLASMQPEERPPADRQAVAQVQVATPLVGPPILPGDGRFDLKSIVAQIQACPFKGDTVVDGCNCKWKCLKGHGYNPNQEPTGVVAKSDCWACVTRSGSSDA